MSNDLWNLWEVQRPPTCKTKVILCHKEINNLKDLLWDMVKTMKNTNDLDSEAALLSRFLYCYKRLFRHEKGMHNLTKASRFLIGVERTVIYQCLKRYIRLNFKEAIDNFKQCIPVKIQPEASHAYLPTRQMLHWILFRLQSFSRLFARIMELSQLTMPYLMGKLNLGWSNKTTLCCFGIVARLWTLSKYYLFKSIEWYNSLYRYQSCFELTADFIPGYEFPADLKKWLVDVDLSLPNKKTSTDDIFELINLVVEDDDGDITIVDDKFLKAALKSKDNSEGPADDVEIVEEVKQQEIKPQPLLNPDLGVPVKKLRMNESKSGNWNSSKHRR
ncbi:hypothetical protein RUM44_013831 [Polyplax serrata]|uniref:Nucleolus and neural progenitor protein-like N-terminal domain-containing protein n=1 Tax=Polyplax serrata TaxID=468196 RepID=A0ABR1BF92_POLSC